MTRAEVLPDLPKPTDEALAASDDLRQALLSSPVVALPKAEGQMIVDVDTCADQFGCTFRQQQPDSTRLPVGYWGRGLSPAEKNYSTTERECLGVVWSVLKLRYFLDGHRFLIRTDHQAPSWTYSTTDTSRRLMRRRLLLSEYTFDMPYKPCASHHAQDFLSRTDNGAAVEDINEDIPYLALAEAAIGLQTGRYTGTDMSVPAEYDDVVEAQHSDEFCVELAKRVALKTAKAFLQNESHALYSRAQYGGQLAIPESLRERILTLEHHATVSTHPGMNRMYYAMRRRYYLPSMVTDIYNTITKCTTCD